MLGWKVGGRVEQENTEKLARLWTESQSVVAAFVFSFVRDFHATEDIVQQVAVVLVREFEKYDPARPFLPWAMGIAKNVALKERREMLKDANRLLEMGLIDQLQMAFEGKSDEWTATRRALRLCLEKQRQRLLEVLRWRYAFDLKPQEIAQRMGITSGAVRVMLHRARSGLRDCIQRKLNASA
ncbi:MAG TPA: sigma-70 family RNA polymerase sigma factor [Pirellulales bacterium]|nr:sigma-70 family RNA polymerase sigma factor [Pirellulales bacterium]